MSTALSDWTTFGIGGSARRLFIATTEGELVDGALRGLVLGRGSNVLVSDDGYDGDVTINRYEEFSVCSSAVEVSSGFPLARLAAATGECGLGGLEWAVGIPGSVGGAVRMNAGAFGFSISDCLEYCDIVRAGEVRRLYSPELGFSYRKSALGDGDVVVKAVFGLNKTTAEQSKHRRDEYRALRLQKQPVGKSAGSIFRNPPGVSIGEAIERAGFKGFRVGGAVVSEKHANVIINDGRATAKDVVRIIETIKAELRKTGLDPKEEIVYIGDF